MKALWCFIMLVPHWVSSSSSSIRAFSFFAFLISFCKNSIIKKKQFFCKCVHLLNDSAQVVCQQLLPLHAAEQVQLGLHKLLLSPVISFPDNSERNEEKTIRNH